MRTVSALILIACNGLLIGGCGDSDPKRESIVSPDTETVIFADIARSAGLIFDHQNGSVGQRYFAEIPGAGGALVDYDNDGDLDVYLIQGGQLPGIDYPAAAPGNRLFENQLVPVGKTRFVDVTADLKVGDTGFGMGVITGDYDNDGDLDMYVLNVGDNVLYRNDDGVFTDVTATSGTNDPSWSASGTFADYDHDGDLDLYVANYVIWRVDLEQPCQDTTGHRDYCAPTNYDYHSDSLFQNNGDGTFSDVSQRAGMRAVAGPGLGVAAADYNGDGLTDFYVANDQEANHLWLNLGDGRFANSGLLSGAAYNAHGAAEASMGVTAGDYDGDGDEDLFMTHLTTQSNTLYRNDGQAGFVDVTERANLGSTSMPFTGFGAAWFDYDNDSLLDLFIANGAVMVMPDRRGKSDFPYEQANQLYRNEGSGRFRDISALAGAAMLELEVSRGAAFGDVDNDGDVDILVTNNNGPVRLLLNQVGQDNSWLRVKLEGSKSPRDGQSARVAVIQSSDRLLWKRVHTDGSYASASDSRLVFGLGERTAPVDVKVVWPSGIAQRFVGLELDTEHVLREIESP